MLLKQRSMFGQVEPCMAFRPTPITFTGDSISPHMSGIQPARAEAGLPPDLKNDSLALARFCADILDSKKIDNIVVRDVRESFQITDYFILGAGLNRRHLKTACDTVDKEVTDRGVARFGLEGYQEGQWILLDFDLIVIHLFLEEQRGYYDLDLLWGGDSPLVDWKP